MVEVLLPTTGTKVNIRGLTVEEELKIASSTTLMAGTMFDLYQRVCQLLYLCIEDSNKPPFDQWLESITENDLQPLMYGVVKETFGDEFPYSYTCPVTHEEVDIKLNLETVQTQGTINDSNNTDNTNLRDVTINGITLTYAPLTYIADTLVPLAFLPLSLKDVINLNTNSIDQVLDVLPSLVGNKPEEEIINTLFSRKVSTIRQIALENNSKIIKRPSVDQIIKLKNFVTNDLAFLKQLPQRQFKNLLSVSENPYSISFVISVPTCKACGQSHEVIVDFFRIAMEQFTTSSF